MFNRGLSCYIKYDIQKFRIASSELRYSTHNLEVERDRQRNITFKNRFCKLCNLTKIEDEYHFTMNVLSLYTEFRKLYLPDITYRIIPLEMFYGLFHGQTIAILNFWYILFVFLLCMMGLRINFVTSLWLFTYMYVDSEFRKYLPNKNRNSWL